MYAKAMLEDPSYSIHSQGWKEKPSRLQNAHLKQMSLKSSIVSAVILTRQNQESSFSKLSRSGRKKGWRILIKDEQRLVDEVKKTLNSKNSIKKAHDPLDSDSDKQASFDVVELNDWELERRAKNIVRQKYADRLRVVEDYISNCGVLEDRPFDSKRWGFDAALRAWVRDSLTYDLYASEVVLNKMGKPHHFYPVDGSTIKWASPMLKFQPREGVVSDVELEILYPEKEAKKIAESGITELDEKKIEEGAYRYVQVIRGRVERAFTEEEMKIGMRNPTTDVYNNGYSIAELELLVSLVTGHLNAEFYNNSYFTQGFSAKGILHIKSNINRRKLESIRIQWQHMLKGAKNSFSTPIFAGVDDVSWIPLVQKHDDIGFENWLRYLTKMICSIYQIDPQELGMGFKEEGGRGGGGMSGDNTDIKIKQSKERGLFPLLRHFQAYINNHLITPFDDAFVLEFTGLSTETEEERVKRLEKLSTFAMDVNEVRDDLDLKAIPGADGVIQNPEYMKWFFAEKMGLVPAGSVDPNIVAASQSPDKQTNATSEKNNNDKQNPNQVETEEKIEKAIPLKIEYFQIKEP